MNSAGSLLKLWSDSSLEVMGADAGTNGERAAAQSPSCGARGAGAAGNAATPCGVGSVELGARPIASRLAASLPLLLNAGMAVSLILGVWEPSLRFQPSVVGSMWAGTFLAGYLVGSFGRGQLWGAVVAVVVGWAALNAFERLTDLGPADSLLLTAMLLFAGWATTVLDPCASPRGRRAAGESCAAARTESRWRWSIWEIGFVTAIVACVVHAGPRLEAPQPLMLAVVAALISGAICSWLACRWVWNDDWNLFNLVGLCLALAAVLAVLLINAPAGLTLGHWLQWLISGPVNVVAAQGVWVLATLGIWRQC